ncbi:efflux RND transporter periplasmic adaptor subunit [Muriventricola aceti]|uniref:efflux RND transporter periplasmic adaptor subunit n=1 Tax=Muriventricola aceti TaxID=2981773 RepID=UPI0008227BE9|nr:HlyD family efflux transporter periplasmic adaptor subunit [Muriventricola aceti]MCU6702869.1 HlyD family efflux transporter periplasmic adaptor subunit [Muriventricola aceti]SCJ23009.1 multidrug efflux system subunit MdtA [uncultured Flavonifractor sp.]
MMKLPVLLKREVPSPEDTPPKSGSSPWKKRLLRKRVLIPVVACVVALSLGIHFFGGGQTALAADLTYTTAAVERRDITSEITGSGSLEAANSYSVTSLVDGTILADYFEEGDQVDEDTVLYDIDSSDMASSLEQSEISLSQAQRSYNNKLKDLADLTVTAPKAGQVVDIAVEAGDDVSAGQTVATIRDSDTMTLKVPFLADEAAGFYVGQSAQVTLDSTFEVLNGTVTEVSGVDQVLTGNVIVRDVTIQVSNPGGLSTSQTGSATVDGCASASGGSFSYLAERSVTAEVSGTVASIHVSEGDRLSQGGAILTLTSDNLEDELQSAAEALRNAELSLESRYDQLDNYTITSPISGTVIDKNYNAGENIETGQTLCSIYDLSYLTLTLNVDELDISNIQVGQQVLITAEAVEGRTYTGVVTKVSVAGTSSSGTTTYPVTIRIDETDGLLPGMNVDATITLDSAGGVLAIPSAALNRGNTVLVTADSPSAANGTLMEGIGGDGEQYYSVPVEVGVSDDSYIEIISGLQEGDTVAYIPTTSSGSFEMGSMMMIPGGGMGSVTISGGPGGGMGGGPGGF